MTLVRLWVSFAFFERKYALMLPASGVIFAAQKAVAISVHAGARDSCSLFPE